MPIGQHCHLPHIETFDVLVLGSQMLLPGVWWATCTWAVDLRVSGPTASVGPGIARFLVNVWTEGSVLGAVLCQEGSGPGVSHASH